MTRRTLLQWGGAGIAAGIAGCLGGDDSPEPVAGADLSGCNLDEEDLSGGQTAPERTSRERASRERI